MRPIIGDSIGDDHFLVIIVCSIEAVGALIDGILSHLPLACVRSVEAGYRAHLVDNILAGGRKARSGESKEAAC